MSTPVQVTKSQVNSLTSNQEVSNKYSVALPTATAKICNDRSRKLRKVIRLLFDQGAQKSLIVRSLAEELHLPVVDKVPYSLGSLHGNTVQSYDVVKVLVRIGARARIVYALVVDNLPDVIHTPGLMNVVSKLKASKINLADMHLVSDHIAEIQMFIGGDFYSSFVQQMVEYEGIKLLKVNHCYMIHGPVKNENFSAVSGVASNNIVVLRITSELIPGEIDSYVENGIEKAHKLWDLDSIGINLKEQSPDEKFVYDEYLKTVKYENNQYWVRLPWKVNRPPLPTNYPIALGQLYSQINNLSKDSSLLDFYNQIIHEQIERGFIEEVPNAYVSQDTHYLPHHGVRKDSKTTPLRIVYNCSSKKDKTVASLNDCLDTGPSLTNKLGDLLIKFRTNKFAYTADISKAFLRIGLQECDRDFTRFLWLEDPHNPKSRIVTYRFKSVLFGAKSSPFLLQATLDHHLNKSNTPIKGLLKDGFYMDNLIGSTDNKREIYKIYGAANNELAAANMPLGQWNTNNLSLQNQISKDFPTYDREDKISILGLIWDVNSDNFNLKSVKFPNYDLLTKRSLLSLVSMVFDPLGLCSPILIKGKLLTQTAWQLNEKWDDELPSYILENWNRLKIEFEQLSNINFPRSVIFPSKNYVLNVFCDASTKAYGTVAYLSDDSGSLLVMSKAKVAPKPNRSIPQLELTAIQLGCSLAKYLKEQLVKFKIEEVNVWSDSEAALHWINGDKSKIIYVRNRVADIKSICEDVKLLNVFSKGNPADLLTRGIKLKEFVGNPLWFNGPNWLHDKNKWPEQKFEIKLVNEVVADAVPVVLPFKSFIQSNKYSNLSKLFDVTKYVFEFIRDKCPSITLPTPEIYWLERMQKENFPLIYSVLEDSKSPPGNDKSKQMVKDLGLYLDGNNLIRSRGRLHHSGLSLNAKNPILLAPKSHLGYLLIVKAHRYTFHAGVQETLGEVRKQFWIPKGRQTVKQIIAACVHCKKLYGKPCRYPGPPSLPVERVTLGFPFEKVGIDYTGSLTITNTDSGLPQKYYICLFTCTSTRAVHLEVANDMSAHTFINLFRRFCSRRSTPRLIITDNGTNFVSSARFFEDKLSNGEVKAYMLEHKIVWKFISPRSPWQGGFYERMIGLVKSCLKKVLYKKKVTYDELQTFVSEVEARVNNRPLTYLTDERDCIEPLTPSHFLHGRTLEVLPPLIVEDPADPLYMDVSKLNKMYSYMSGLASKFDKLWHNEYLLSLREKHYGNSKAEQPLGIQEGDVVLIDNNNRRTSWPLGRIINLNYDCEGVARTANVICKGITSAYTLEKLIPLEVREIPDQVNESVDELDPGREGLHHLDSTRAVDEDSSRPRRAAADRAQRFLRGLIDKEQL